jgi:hypothetical protein
LRRLNQRLGRRGTSLNQAFLPESLERLRAEIQGSRDPAVLALLENDMAVLLAAEGDVDAAFSGFHRAINHNPGCNVARRNLQVLGGPPGRHVTADSPKPAQPNHGRAKRIAFVSLLFNWPSTGGGTVHTFEAAKFLQQAGYQVRHFYAVQQHWGVGLVTKPLAVESVPLSFSADQWNADSIRHRFREAVTEFAPDCVIVTDDSQDHFHRMGSRRGARTRRLISVVC